MSSSIGNRDGDSNEDFINELLEFGDEYQSNDFPNPNREGCPDEQALFKAVRSGSLIDEVLREHLLTCSPCFTDFKNMKNAGKTSSYPKALVAGIGTFTVVVLFAIALFVFTDFNPTDGTEISGNNTRKGSESPEEKTVPPLKKEFTNTVPKTQSNTTSFRTFDFDIASNNVDRGGLNRAERKLLPAERVKIRVRLSDGSPSGMYRVSLLDEFGRSLSSEIRTTSDGIALAASLDLSRLGGPARLCVAAGDEVPDCFSVLIK